jgi:hypothetical protein
MLHGLRNALAAKLTPESRPLNPDP